MSCSSCKHSTIDLTTNQAGKLICRRYPPIAAPVTVPTEGGMSIQVISIWPPVAGEYHCGEFEVAAPAFAARN